MNNPAQGQAKPTTQSNISLIRVDQVPKLPHLNDQEKAQTQSRVQQLWDIVNNASETEQRRRQAHQHLVVLSQQMMQAMKTYTEQQKQTQQARQQVSQPVQRTASQNAPAPQSVATAAPTTPAAAAPNTANTATPTPSSSQLLPEVQQQIDAYQFCLPPAMTAGTKPAEDWLKEAKSRLGSALQRMQQAKTQKANISRLAMTKQQQGGLSAADQNTFNEKMTQFNRFIAESQTFLEKFREQQSQFRLQRSQSTPAVERSHVEQPSAITNADTQRSQSIAVGAAPLAQAPQLQTQAAGIQTPTQISTPSTPVPAVHMNPQQPQSLPTTPAAPLQRPPFPHQAGSGMLTAPGPNNFKLSQPPAGHVQQGQMHTPRPGFNGPNAAPQRSMTEPVLSAIPGYALEQSADNTVLSRKKLKELVSELLGAEADGLTADAEDLCIQFVDDFVDDIISQGCKLAKMRGANHLDVRDIQVVLERQYNMRIPGFSTDELRVARRPAPAPGWTQKINAINSSK